MATMRRPHREKEDKGKASASGNGYGYRAGYEPTAPPAPQEHSAFGSRQQHQEGTDFFLGEQYPPAQFDPRRPGLEESEETLGQQVLGILAGVARGLWRTSHTVLRLELRRGISYQGPVVRRPAIVSGRERRHGTIADQAGATVSTGGHFYAGQAKGFSDQEWAPVEDAYVDTGRRWEGGGARLKLMQVWDFPEVKVQRQKQELGLEKVQEHEPDQGKEEPEHPQVQDVPWRVNLGLGANVDTDRGLLEPRFRVRGQHVALHLLPEPLLEIRGKWPLFNTQLALDARYRVPLLGLPNLWSGDSGARLMLNLFNPLGTGIHLTPGGLEFDEHLVRLGEHTIIRVAAAVDFPRQFPLPEGEQPVKIRINRLGLKTRIQ